LALSKFSGQNVGENLVTFKKIYLAAVTKSRDRTLPRLTAGLKLMDREFK